ncbi:MAG: polyketide synthase dehydratase domain-containing protein, partial [Pseudomonadota bacterium]
AVRGQLLLPSPAYMDWALQVAGRVLGEGPVEIADFLLHRACPVEPDSPTTLQLALSPAEAGAAPFRVAGRRVDGGWVDGGWGDGGWQTLCEGRLVRSGAPLPPPGDTPGAIAARIGDAMPLEAFRALLSRLSLDFGEPYRGVHAVSGRPGEAIARMELPASLAPEAGAHRIHPALLDACMHVIAAALPAEELDDPFLLLGADRIVLRDSPAEGFWSHVRVDPEAVRSLRAQESFGADVRLLAADGSEIGALEGLRFKRAGAAALGAGAASGAALSPALRRMMIEVAWPTAPEPARLVADTAPLLDRLAGENGLRDRHPAFSAALDRLSAAYAARAFAALGWTPEPGTVVEAEGLLARLGIEPRHGRLVARLLTMLGEDGVLAAAGAGWRVLRTPETVDVETAKAELLARYPECAAQIEITHRCALDLAAVLTGQADPLALLFPDGSLAQTEALYADAPPARAYNAAVAELVGRAAANLADAGRIRVLEIGAGTGSATVPVLAQLEQALGADGLDRLDYVFTDISPLFLQRARERFADRAWMRFETLDVTADPASQGFAAGSFDIVIAGNVLHATPDLAETLGRVGPLLAPDGLLVLLEGTAPQRFGDLTVGLLEGWWAYRDTERRDYALMPRGAWMSLLGELGFREAAVLPGEGAAGTLSEQAIFVARAPSPAPGAGRWLILPGDEMAGPAAAALAAAGAPAEIVAPE